MLNVVCFMIKLYFSLSLMLLPFNLLDTNTSTSTLDTTLHWFLDEGLSKRVASDRAVKHKDIAGRGGNVSVQSGSSGESWGPINKFSVD